MKALLLAILLSGSVFAQEIQPFPPPKTQDDALTYYNACAEIVYHHTKWAVITDFPNESALALEGISCMYTAYQYWLSLNPPAQSE